MDFTAGTDLQTGSHLEPLFLRACRNEQVETTPVWLLSQAGTYLPEHRRLREGKSAAEVMITPDLATEASLQPIRRFGFDACVVFSDPLVPTLYMGVGAVLDSTPHVESPVRSEEAMQNLRRPDPVQDLGFVMETLRNLRRELPPTVALIGLSAGPFTLAGFLVEGTLGKECPRLKSLMFSDPVSFHALMEKVSMTVSEFLREQIEQGAQAVQIVDPLAGALAPRDYSEHVLPHLQRVMEAIHVAGVPRILYGFSSGSLLKHMMQSGADVLGLDWRVDMAEARKRVGDSCVLQGNLDPDALFAPPQELEERVIEILDASGPQGPHIFNVGHDMSSSTPVHSVEALVSFVHQAGKKLRSAENISPENPA